MTNLLSLAFVLFLGCACLVYFILPRAARSAWLLCCSYLFYCYDPANAGFVVLLLALTLVTYLTGLALGRAKALWLRRALLALCLAGCAGCFLWFKYAKLLTGAAAALCGALGLSLKVGVVSIAAPLGISYFAFMAMGYLIDVYRGQQAPEKNIIYYALFVSFFPLMTAGPIERAGQLLPQLRQPAAFDYDRVAGGMFRILWGFFKKLVIANTLMEIVNTVYANVRYEAYSGPVLLLCTLLFSYELYCDFSACTDIALGAGAIFGIRLMENFRRPFAAGSFTELWRRWHISLTNWFRDYLYIPLGGNRKGALRQNLNTLIVFTVSGLWHGGTLPYFVWGLLNGAYLCVGKATAAWRKRVNFYNPLYRFAPVRKAVRMGITYLLFSSCIVFFVVGLQEGGTLADALYVYGHLFTGWGQWAALGETLAAIGFKTATTAVLVFSVFLVESMEHFMMPMDRLIRKIPIVLRWPLYYTLVLGILFFGRLGASFIYQQY